MKNILDHIREANDIKKVNQSDYGVLAEEIREFMITAINRTGGHLAANLGVVELTMAIHLCLTFPEDKLIFDVGHQSYVHKILTGRKEDFKRIRSYGGISGFPNRFESSCDAFGTGHSSTAISAALGFAAGRDRLKENYKVIAVVGDGAATGGMFYEAVNNLVSLHSNIVIILNENSMSISPNVGAVAEYLKVAGEKQTGFWDQIQIDCRGPFDGHDMDILVPAIENALISDRPVLLHVRTVKGKGCKQAEKNPELYHGINGNRYGAEEQVETYTDVFGKTMLEMAGKESVIVAVCAAMEYGVGLHEYHECYPERFFDVGIAEEHAVTFAAGLAAAGLKPYVAIYSSFLQRAFDQIIHDVCLQKLPVVFCIDRAGIVGEDGATHQGIFDLSYLSLIPGITIAAPGDKNELTAFLRWSMEYPLPLAIRYPKGGARMLPEKARPEIRLGKSEVLVPGEKIALLAVGSMVQEALEIYDIMLKKEFRVSVINVRFVKPFDKKLLFQLAEKHKLFVTMEENTVIGGYGQQVSNYLSGCGSQVHVLNIGIEDAFVKQGTAEEMKKELNMDKEALAERIMKEYQCFDGSLF